MGNRARLNESQLRAAEHDEGPLLIVAGAGTGKTTTLAHRVVRLVERGVDPSRILLLTFARRAAAEMLRTVDGLLRGGGRGEIGKRVWGGTFHAVAARLLRIEGESLGLPPTFGVIDRADAEDLLDLVRSDLGLAAGGDDSDGSGRSHKRFPRKSTCMDLYSRGVNARLPLDELVAEHYPWCREHVDDLRRLFQVYCDRKAEQALLDYDDLLLFWHALAEDAASGGSERRRFDCVLVDEYQDTNALQAELLRNLCPEGAGLTVVGDDAQAIYSFRGATVRNILDFPRDYAGATVVKLEQSYRSTPPLLAATNAVIAEARERHDKRLFSTRPDGARPQLVHCQDAEEEADFVVRRVLEHREAGTDLKRQAVLFRTAHHSLALELELGRRRIPFHKFGGLRFVEAAHVKDLVAFLRLVENPRDRLAGLRVLQLLPGVGPRIAARLCDEVGPGAQGFAAWRALRPPSAAATLWPELVELLEALRAEPRGELPSQIARVRGLWARLVEDRYEDLEPRLRDLEQIEALSSRHEERQELLTELALDPPSSTQDLAGPPMLDEDYLNLSTIHSAKGLEWDVVYTIHAADGDIPSDLATGRVDEIEEERRLLYVALSRARDALYVSFPLRQHAHARRDRYTMAQLTRFVTPTVRACFEERTARPREVERATPASRPSVDADGIRRRIRAMF